MKITQLRQTYGTTARLIEFAGFEMPVWYTSIMEEHLAVRSDCGIFDVSHMGRFRVKGPESGRLLDSLVPTSIASQPEGRSIYTLLLNTEGGILDDLIIMKLGDDDYLVVVNAINRERDLAQVDSSHGRMDVEVADETSSSAMIAVQGPRSGEALQPLTETSLSELRRFRCAEGVISGHPAAISRTGYTGEDGFEIILHDASIDDPESALDVWASLLKTARPCGLGARDSLRIEAGYPLYGNEINERTDPFEADLAWVVSKEKKGYVGYDSIARLGERPPPVVRRGIVLREKIPRSGFPVLAADSSKVGTVTSGTFSPILRRGIALALIDSTRAGLQNQVRVSVRDAEVAGEIVKPPFYDEKLFGWKRQVNGK
ncbi:MAG TPA: glycine cleavage system aminomethyltransferase GcvT [Nitrososphaerales archaeon]|nr:glycine cleavage system aminomethyltransferase GcvT [Nitrososphaerales archaeon]